MKIAQYGGKHNPFFFSFGNKNTKDEFLSFSSHTRAGSLYLNAISYKDAFFFQTQQNKINFNLTANQERLITHAIEREKRKDQAWRRLPTRNKRPIKGITKGYNLPTWKEKRNHATLLKKYGEITTLTGKKLGELYHSSLDIDIFNEKLPEGLRKKLTKEITNLLKRWGVSFDLTKKGGHVDLLTTELLPNEKIVYYWWNKPYTIGSIQSKGKYAVDVDDNKRFVKNGKWYKKFKENSREELKRELSYFFLLLGNQQEKTSKITISNIKPSKRKKTIQKPKQIITNLLTINQRIKLSAKILKIIKLNIKGVDYLRYNLKSKTHYFLYNTHNGSKDPPLLKAGETYDLVLKGGRLHPFFVSQSPYQ